MKRHCDSGMVTAEYTISGETAGAWSVKEARVIESHFLEFARNKTRSIENGNKVAQEEKGKCDQDL